MSARLWTVAAAYHLLVGGACLWVARSYARAAAARARAGSLVLRAVVSAALLGLTAVAAALLMGRLLPDTRFANLRFLAQALFGEGLLLTAWVALVLLRHGRGRLSLLAWVPLALLLVTYWQAYHVGPHDLRIRTHAVDRSGPTAEGVLRVLHLSDIQACEIGGYERRVIREAMRLAPDLILMTGDYVHARTDDRERLDDELRELLRGEHFGAPLGVFAVGGDTDGGNEHLFDGLGVRWLADESATVRLPGGKNLVIVGLTRARSRLQGGQDPLPVVQAAPQGDLVFVIGHGPDYVMALAGHVRVDLALAGHSHGGQVVLPFFGPPMTLTRIPRRYAAGGLVDYHGLRLHVSRGIGMERGSAPQIRFLCPPEICLLEVRY